MNTLHDIFHFQKENAMATKDKKNFSKIYVVKFRQQKDLHLYKASPFFPLIFKIKLFNGTKPASA